MSSRSIDVAPREFKRLIGAGVSRSFFKTLTEPITNSDSELKNKASVKHASGLIDRMLTLNVGDSLDTSKLKSKITKTPTREILIELWPTKDGPVGARTCRIIDHGRGMTEEDLVRNFGTYAEGKARGQGTRSLFGRGALDVLLFHEDSTIYSVHDGVLSRCQLFWGKDNKPKQNTATLGPATVSNLKEYNLPKTIKTSGTVVQFIVKKDTNIPQQSNLLTRISNYYMLRLIASDPNTSLKLVQHRSQGESQDRIIYDFPIGTVLCRKSDTLRLPKSRSLPVDILVVRADEQLMHDYNDTERRENGLLFIDDNDAVLDLTLLPEADRDPYLGRIFGIVRISGIRQVLEDYLDADDAEAILTQTRDGFDKKHDVTKRIFDVVHKHVKPVYDKEAERQRRGSTNRTEKLSKRIKDALKALNQFSSDETDDDGTDKNPPPEKPNAIYFGMSSTRLVTEKEKRIHGYINLEKVAKNQVVLIECDNPNISVEPDSVTVKSGGKRRRQPFVISVNCGIKGQEGKITAMTEDKSGSVKTASLRILGVDDPPPLYIPENIEFSKSTFSGTPGRTNNATLLVNLAAFPGLPEISFEIVKAAGSVTLGDDAQPKLKIKASKADIVTGTDELARITVAFNGTGWGQHARLEAKAKTIDGKLAKTASRLKFERPEGNNRYSDFIYEKLDRNVLGEVAQDKIYVNATYPVHQHLFGSTQEDFDQSLETSPTAQLRAAQVVVEAAVYHAADSKYHQGGKKGLEFNVDDPITSLRMYIESSRMKLEPPVFRALAPKT